MSLAHNNALLLAGGSGTRMQGSVDDKVLLEIGGQTVFDYSLNAFASSDQIHRIAVVYRDEAQRDVLEQRIRASATPHKTIIWAIGGAERQDSVCNGLEALPMESAVTLIHDCARPLITTQQVEQLIDIASHTGAACLAHPVTDTIKRLSHTQVDTAVELKDLDRDKLWAMETPQAFSHSQILKAYQKVKAEGLTITDDTAAATLLGIKVSLVRNDKPNLKITTTKDISHLEWLLNQ